MPTFEPGSRGSCQTLVSSSDTAQAVGSGDVPVLATPRLLALLEQASCEAVRSGLDDGQTTVGVSIELAHRAATPVGARVVAEAELISVDGGKLTLRLSAHDERAPIADGTVVRAVVNREAFVDRAYRGQTRNA